MKKEGKRFVISYDQKENIFRIMDKERESTSEYNMDEIRELTVLLNQLLFRL